VRLIPSIVIAAAALLAAASAHAQDDTLPSPFPSCAEQGVARVAVMIPPGKSEDEIRAAVMNGNFFPAGTEVRFLRTGQLTRLRNQQDVGSRINLALNRFLNEGIEIDGSVSMLLKLDDRGNVVEVHPNTGNGEVNSILTRTWREARFDPYVLGGCRVAAWIQVPQNFQSDFSLRERSVRVDARPIPPPSPRR
jgi:hypothetical protein